MARFQVFGLSCSNAIPALLLSSFINTFRCGILGVVATTPHCEIPPDRRPSVGQTPRGGSRTTLTNADVVLGYLDPEFFLGGEMRLDADAARAAIEAHVARPAGLDPIRAAWGVHEIANEDVARAFRIHASERGFDYRRSSMVAFGGSGPVHALAIARKLRIPRVIFPIGAGVMSALGLLVSPLGFEVSRSRRVYLADLDAASFEGFIAPLVEEASGFLHRAGIADPHISTRLDMRYQGQGYEIEVTLPDGAIGTGIGAGYAEVFARLDERFRARYAEIFAETFLDEPLEIVSWKVEATGEEAALDYASIAGSDRARDKRRRNVWFRDAFVECEVLDRYALEPGMTIEGPAVIEERESTCVLGPGDRATVDAHLNLVADLADGESKKRANEESDS